MHIAWPFTASSGCVCVDVCVFPDSDVNCQSLRQDGRMNKDRETHEGEREEIKRMKVLVAVVVDVNS